VRRWAVEANPAYGSTVLRLDCIIEDEMEKSIESVGWIGSINPA
jgi:hypothetical protein